MALLKKILNFLDKKPKGNPNKDYQADFKPLRLTTEYKPFTTAQYKQLFEIDENLLQNDKVTPSSHDKFEVIVVGVSFYQETLEEIFCNRREEGIALLTQANVIPDDGNSSDAYAVSVEIEQKLVGHLSRKNARIWRSKMISDKHTGVVICPAKIVWDRGAFKEGSYGVWLDLDLTLPDSKPEMNIVQSDSVSDNQPNHIEFIVNELNLFELSNCKEGDDVNLWVAEGTREIFIYRQGTDFGEGKIGVCPDELFKTIRNAPGCDAKIVSIYEGGCKIDCRLISKAEMKERMLQVKEAEKKKKAALKERKIEKLFAEFQKKYAPKTSIKARFDIKKSYKLAKDDKIFLDIKSKNFYLRYPNQLRVDLLNHVKERIGELRAQEPVLRIIKAAYNGYEFDLNINSVYEHEFYPKADIEIMPKKKADQQKKQIQD